MALADCWHTAGDSTRALRAVDMAFIMGGPVEALQQLLLEVEPAARAGWVQRSSPGAVAAPPPPGAAAPTTPLLSGACAPPAFSHAQVANRNARVWARRDSEWCLNDGQIPNTRGVRVALGTDYHRVEVNRRASRNGRVSDLPPEIPKVTIRNFCVCSVVCFDQGETEA
jgi:hypothetical protein